MCMHVLNCSRVCMISIHDVKVAAVTGDGTALCSSAGTTSSVEFLFEFGDLPAMAADRTALLDSTNTGYNQFHWGYAIFSESYKGGQLHLFVTALCCSTSNSRSWASLVLQALKSTTSVLDKAIAMRTWANASVWRAISPAVGTCTCLGRG